MLVYSIAEHYKAGWCEKVLFALEQPQDPREYRSNQDVQRHGYMNIWRMAAWKSFAAKYGFRHTSFEQGTYGHVKPKPTTAAHNIRWFG